ncbi:alpha/beta-hydrolase [Meredithblackwellia eburnea MCA 4105]
MVSECCVQGYFHSGVAVGKETVVAGLPAYVSGPEESKKAVLIISDVYGYKLNNIRVLADHYASDANVRVFVPDFFGGAAAPTDPEGRAKWFANIELFKVEHSPHDPKHLAKVEEVIAEIRKTHSSIAAMSFCWGAPAALHLSAKGLVECTGVAHPTETEVKHYTASEKPTLVLCAATDHMFPPVLRNKVEEAMEVRALEARIWSKFVLYPGTVHGFASRGDEKDDFTATAMADAKATAVAFFNQFL